MNEPQQQELKRVQSQLSLNNSFICRKITDDINRMSEEQVREFAIYMVHSHYLDKQIHAELLKTKWGVGEQHGK